MLGFVEVTNAGVWMTNVYAGIYCNDFVKSGIAWDIKKRIISNGVNGSS